MSKTVIIVLFALVACVAAVSPLQQACQYVLNDTINYNLFSFSSLPVQNVSLTHGENKYNLTFHLCNRQVVPCGVETKKAGTNNYLNAILTHNDEPETCRNVTNANDHPIASAFDSTNASLGLVLTFASERSKNQNASFKVMLTCDEKVAAKDIAWELFMEDSLDYSSTEVWIKGAGQPGCPSSLEAIKRFFENYKLLFGLVFIIIGAFALFAGLRFFNVTVFIISALGISLALTVVVFEATSYGQTTGGKWGIFIVSVLIGLLCGYIAVKIERVGFFILGSVLGGVGGLFLHTLLVHFFEVSGAVFLVLLALTSAIGGALSVWLWRNIIILATSCIGSYLLVRGLSFFIGGFPAELDIAQKTAVFDYKAYIYLAAMVVLTLVGMVHQFKKKKRLEEIEEDYYKEPSVATF